MNKQDCMIILGTAHLWYRTVITGFGISLYLGIAHTLALVAEPVLENLIAVQKLEIVIYRISPRTHRIENVTDHRHLFRGQDGID